MAITSESQILNLESVNSSLSYLDQSVSQLEGAINELNDAKSYCDSNSFSIKGNNTFPSQIDLIIADLETLKSQIKAQKEAIYEKAVSIRRQEINEYNAYKEEQRRLEEERMAAQNAQTLQV